MSEVSHGQVAIIDYGMGNLFSVKHACETVGLTALITRRARDLSSASAVILPGVGAFGEAMKTLTRLDLVSPLREIADSPTPLVGICLGMQLLMTESHEFGRYRGLNIIEGEVLRLRSDSVKVPQVGWNQIHPPREEPDHHDRKRTSWEGTFLEGLADGDFMYFVHSYYCKPSETGPVLSTTRYGGNEFCSSLAQKNVFACQFHPERSGLRGVQLYRNIAQIINRLIPEDQRA